MTKFAEPWKKNGRSRIFWAQLPECTSKSGWITLTAATMSWRRAELQIAVCTVGIEVALQVPQLVPQHYTAEGLVTSAI